jgi:hypothetical protein
MKVLSSVLALCLLLEFSQSSCTKEVPVPYTDTMVLSHMDTLYNIDTLYITQPSSIYGLWIGHYNTTSGPDAGRTNLYYSYELHKDYTMQMTGVGADGMSYYGIGTWSLKGPKFSGHITTTNLGVTGTQQTIYANYDSVNNKLSGIVSDDDLRSPFKANLEMEKVQ